MSLANRTIDGSKQTPYAQHVKPTNLQKLLAAVNHLVSFQKSVEGCNSAFLVKVNGVEVTASKQELQGVEISLEGGKIEIKLSGDRVLRGKLEDGRNALSYVDNPMFTDCTIRLGENSDSFLSHKQYLKRCSKYFEATLSNFVENDGKYINIKVMYPKAFMTVLLELIYSGTLSEGLRKEWNENNDLFFWLMWSAVYLQIKDLRYFLLKNFAPSFRNSTLFDYQHFTVATLDLWIGKYCEISRKIRSVSTTQAQSRCQEHQLAVYSDLEILELCFVWTAANRQEQAELADGISRLINKHHLLRASSIHVIKRFVNKRCPGLQKSLDPLGADTLRWRSVPELQLLPCFATTDHK